MQKHSKVFFVALAMRVVIGGHRYVVLGLIVMWWVTIVVAVIIVGLFSLAFFTLLQQG